MKLRVRLDNKKCDTGSLKYTTINDKQLNRDEINRTKFSGLCSELQIARSENLRISSAQKDEFDETIS